MKNILLAFASGGLGALAFAPYDQPWAVLFPLLGLCHFMYRRRHQAKYCWLVSCSFIFFSALWLRFSMTEYSNVPIAVALLAILGMAGYLSLFYAAAVFIANKCFCGRIFVKNVVVIPALWILADWLGADLLSGFPWMYLGYTQTDTYIANLAPYAGVFGITLFLLCASSMLYYAAFRRSAVSAIGGLVLLAMPLFVEAHFTEAKPSLKVALVQGNIDQIIKWDRARAGDIFMTYYELTAPYFRGEKKVDAVIWPESAVPELENFASDVIEALDIDARTNDFSLITGIQYYDVDRKQYHNSVIGIGLIDSEKQERYTFSKGNRYYKRHLVPIGEKVPFDEFLRTFGAFFNMPMSSFTPGEEIQPNIIAGNLKVATAICYEIAFPDEILPNMHDDTNAIVTVSNDGWFGTNKPGETPVITAGPWQHAKIAKMRALEFQKPVLRATNNGLTVVYAADGTSLGELPFYEKGVLEASVTPMTGHTPFGKHGILICLSLSMLMLATAFSYLLTMMMTTKRKKS